MLTAEEELIFHLSDVDPDEKYFNLIISWSNSTNRLHLILVSEYNEIYINKKSHVNIFSENIRSFNNNVDSMFCISEYVCKYRTYSKLSRCFNFDLNLVQRV